MARLAKATGTGTLIVLPQIIAALAFATPWAFITELPPDADGNARVSQGGGALIVGFLLVFVTLPIAWCLLGLVLGGEGKRRETAATSFSLSGACFFIPLVFAPALGLESSVLAFLIGWLAINLLAITALRNHDLFARSSRLDSEDIPVVLLGAPK